MSEETFWLRLHRSRARRLSYGNMSSTAFNTLTRACRHVFRSQLHGDAKASQYRTMVAGCHRRTLPISFACMEKISNALLAEQAGENGALGNRLPLALQTSF